MAARAVDSTNAVARRIAVECGRRGAPPGTILIASWEQTAGRGRRGNSWRSPAGAGVYASLLLQLPGPSALVALPLLVPAVLCRRIDRRLGGGVCRIKWPNDLLVGGEKIGGVLLETLSPAPGGPLQAIVGFGVNHGEAAAGDGATCLERHTGTPPSVAGLTLDLASSLLRRRHRLEDVERAVESFRRLAVHRPGDRLSYRSDGGVRSGIFRGFDARGFLRLQEGGGETLLAAAELVE